jgi:hypothetical protein
MPPARPAFIGVPAARRLAALLLAAAAVFGLGATIGFTGGESGRQCAGVERIFAAKGKKGALRAP